MKIWDLSARIYHWLQATLFCLLLASVFAGKDAHIPLGLMLFTLIVWRLIWGVVGSDTSRFTHFLRSPSSVINYLRGKEKAKAGHNPLGGWMVVCMISTLLLQCISGLALAGLLDNLPFAEFWLTDNVFTVLESIHLLLANGLPILIALHLGAILLYKLRAKPLVKAMFTGYQNERRETPNTLYFASNTRAFIVLTAAGFVTIAIVAFA
ncbi:cytochrome b/b6 domain-containing protein [Photobacterium sanguinicancri]|uniref:cytochrome b/b6 domain-containing protein n=1 Tax=Photobacterium sanguinicancri TaxID=875932 RepID=UPI0026E2C135|nr:cytochrome b/b6 domain-containing protein [Photobacterium sanguinicancri]MDO6497951.1 cytochrome b/b6 domain-containing protein [Photobacterium sanguinicancri]